MESEGSIFQTTSDTEIVLHLMARSQTPDITDALVEALHHVTGAFSMVCLAPGRLIAVRDPVGFRPLSLGRVDDAWVVASESCAFDLLGAEHVRDLERGEKRALLRDYRAEIVVETLGGRRRRWLRVDRLRLGVLPPHLWLYKKMKRFNIE